jgi:hypothetical protein
MPLVTYKHHNDPSGTSDDATAGLLAQTLAGSIAEKLKQAGSDETKRQHVVDTMKRAFWKYRLHAWGKDEILAVSGNARDNR